jgi:hypothetical protein
MSSFELYFDLAGLVVMALFYVLMFANIVAKR